MDAKCILEILSSQQNHSLEMEQQNNIVTVTKQNLGSSHFFSLQQRNCCLSVRPSVRVQITRKLPLGSLALSTYVEE